VFFLLTTICNLQFIKVLDFVGTMLLKSRHMEKKDSKTQITIDQTETQSGIHLKMQGSFSGTEDAAIHFFEHLSNALEKNPKEIVLDMGETMMIDSMAIGLLVGFLIKGRERGILVRIESINDTVKRILDTTGLNKAFPALY
jgi:anti-anti-sigma factor